MPMSGARLRSTSTSRRVDELDKLLGKLRQMWQIWQFPSLEVTIRSFYPQVAMGNDLRSTRGITAAQLRHLHNRPVGPVGPVSWRRGFKRLPTWSSSCLWPEPDQRLWARHRCSGVPTAQRTQKVAQIAGQIDQTTN